MAEEMKSPVGEGYSTEGRVLEEESLVAQEPVATAMPSADADAQAGAALEAKSLNPSEPVAAAAAAPASVGYGAEGDALEQAAVAPYEPVAAPQAAYHATYGAPVAACSTPAPQAAPVTQTAPQSATAPQAAPQAAPQPAPATQAAVPVMPPSAHPTAPVAPAPNSPAAATAAALKKTRTDLDPERVFLICGIVVGCIIIVFGLCMLAFYTPAEVSEFFDTYKMNGSTGFSDTGATAQQILKAGFSMLLIGIGATDICAFGAKLMKSKGSKADQK